MSGENKPGTPPDPFSFWKQMMGANEEAFSNAMNQYVNSEAYAASMGKYMENAMAVQKIIQENMEKFLHANGLPTRTDFARLAEQIVEIDGRLDDLQDRLDETSTPTELQKLAGQVSALEVRLSRIEGLLEQVLKVLPQAPKPITTEPVVAPDTNKPETEGYYSLGEASPTNRRSNRKKTAPAPQD